MKNEREEIDDVESLKKQKSNQVIVENIKCLNSSCKCPDCTCGLTCTCGISPEVSCNPCNDFKAVMMAKKAVVIKDAEILSSSTSSSIDNEEIFNLPLSYVRPSKEDGAPINFSNFINVLYNYIDDINKYPKCIYMVTNNFVVIYDLFPKSTIHLLVIPKSQYLHCNKIIDIKKEMKDQIIEMNFIATKIAQSDAIQNICRKINGNRNKDNYIKCGFHAIPSLHPLHLHIVSTDFDSDQLKNAKHWNSFTTDFFVESSTVISWLENDKLPINELPSHIELENKLKNPLKCHHCNNSMKNMPSLKKHILGCNR